MAGMSRRGFAAFLAGGMVGASSTSAVKAQAVGRTFSIIDFFGQEPRAWEAVQGYPQANYQYLAGSAASASTRRLPAEMGLRPLAKATFQAIWTAPDFNAAIELAHCDDDFVNYTQFAECQPIVVRLPDIQKRDITAALNTLIANGQSKHLVCRARGDGTTGALIFGASIELIWT